MSRELIDRIAEKLEQVSDDNEFLYRKSTGEIICRDPEFLDESTLEDIEVNWKDYILLPTQYDIHEYRIMHDFAVECPYEQMREKMLASLKGKGAFRQDLRIRFSISGYATIGLLTGIIVSEI